MNEVRAARSYLSLCQSRLADTRARKNEFARPDIAATLIRREENQVLAALSWVWDAQQRAMPKHLI